MKRLLLTPLLALGCAHPVEQTEACAQYVSCIEARDLELGVTTDLERFRAEGDCWGSEEGGGLCDRGCDNGLIWLNESYDALPEECAR